MSGPAENDSPAASLDQSDDTAAGPEVNDLAAARAQLRARAGARGRRISKPGHGAGGQGQVKAYFVFPREACASLPQVILLQFDHGVLLEEAYVSVACASEQ